MFPLRTSPAVIVCDGPPVASGAATKNEAGQTVQRFDKDIIRVGKFSHPASGQAFEITPDWLDNAVVQFGRMLAAGVKVPVPSGHSFDAEKNRGWVRRMYRDGDRLRAEIDLVGEDAIKLAGRNEVSIYAEPEFKDGNGQTYPWAIQHVALTPTPVVPGQDSFRAIAASRDGVVTTTDTPVFRLAAKGPAMENLTKLAGILGISTEGKDEAALWGEVLAACGKMKPETEMQAVAASRDAIQTELNATKAKLEEATKKPEEPHPQVLKYARAHRNDRIDSLVKDARITKDAGDELKAMWVGDEKTLALSRTLDAESDGRFDKLVTILAALPPIRPTGETNAIEASRRPAIDAADNDELDPRLEAKRAEWRKQEAALAKS